MTVNECQNRKHIYTKTLSIALISPLLGKLRLRVNVHWQIWRKLTVNECQNRKHIYTKTCSIARKLSENRYFLHIWLMITLNVLLNRLGFLELQHGSAVCKECLIISDNFKFSREGDKKNKRYNRSMCVTCYSTFFLSGLGSLW